MQERSYTMNRELSWLMFNQRVLEEAADKRVPLYERLKFISIFTSNLDEFYMIRVGGLVDSAQLNPMPIDNKTGWTPNQQLEHIYKQTEILCKQKDKIYQEVIDQFLNEGVQVVTYKQLAKIEKSYIKQYFHSSILPMLSPQIIDLSHPLAPIPNKTMNIVLLLQKNGKKYFGIVPVPNRVKRLVYLRTGFKFLFSESIVYEMVDALYPNYEILDKAIISITRNADIHYDHENFDFDDDYRDAMKKLLKKRNKLLPVRLEVTKAKGQEVIRFIQKQLQIQEKQTFYVKTPLDMSFAFELPGKFTKKQKERFCYSEYTPQILSDAIGAKSITKLVRSKDLLMHYPYESMDTFVSLIEEASKDRSVLSIKMTIYRLASDAKIVEHLCNAAENGKEVIVIMELRARFDEQNNIDYSRQLEDAGCKIYYGLEDYKVHSKICLITYRIKDKISYITQIGTGNYNEKTAKLYTDLSLITASQEIGEDGDVFFRNLLISNVDGEYKHLLVAPNSLSSSIQDLIDEQIERAKAGKEAQVIMKVNGFTDVAMIHKVKEASCAGVVVKLVVRGICCLIPGVIGKTENVEVYSIVGKYLEHHRIYAFGTGESMKMYIGSADAMSRNLSKRVEIACPILDSSLKKELYRILRVILEDNRKARQFLHTGIYTKVAPSYNEVDSQIVFEDIAIQRTLAKRKFSQKVKDYIKTIKR